MGVFTIRSILSACRRRVVPLLAQLPPFAGDKAAVRGGEVAVQGGEVTVRGGEAPASPTTSATNADDGVFQLRLPALWAHRCLAVCVARTFTLRCEREPAIACANRLYRT